MLYNGKKFINEFSQVRVCRDGSVGVELIADNADTGEQMRQYWDLTSWELNEEEQWFTEQYANWLLHHEEVSLWSTGKHTVEAFAEKVALGGIGMANDERMMGLL